ncbi:helix-turn-helix transcriptional regulator [Hymenobacter metallicola]|uniref:DNA-binding protein n=1 Tax=Hymenobacter metallicola TaxID=2563114 RepID=A0A4Z0QJ87_9BACT|nr:DNA-binding protein [Hymenobacter metallicola]TGE29755.1 DNA-binding protein [Hymenobacter metallicola]
MTARYPAPTPLASLLAQADSLAFTQVEHHDSLFKELLAAVKTLALEVQTLKEGQAEWVSQKEAMKLCGRSRAWFYEQRNRDTLPIRVLPPTKGSREVKYNRADCLAYAQANLIAPPPTQQLQ